MTPSACFSCLLPDCDERSPRCALKRAAAEATTLRNRGLPIPDDLKAASREAHRIWEYDSRAEAAERRASGQDHQHG